MTRSLATSPDGQWAAVRDGRELALLAAGAGPHVAKLELDSDDVDLALVGPPNVLVTVTRADGKSIVTLYQPPYLDVAARLEIDGTVKIATTTGPRVALVSADGNYVAVVRGAGRALASQKLDVAGPIEFIVGLERNQLLFGLLKKLEVWDAVSGRPLLRPQFQLPPPPRVLGAAAGHLWATGQNGEEIFVYRLSDGRPFRHHAGSPIQQVICHPSSPVLVLVTERGLMRLHCYSHSLSQIEDVPNPPGALAQLAIGENISLLGHTGDGEPWRITIDGSSSSTTTTEAVEARSVGSTNAERPTHSATATSWREPLVAFGQELLKGADTEVPTHAINTELGALAHRLGLGSPARRALIALYALHLVGDPALSIAALANALGDWSEPLGQGELGALAMLRRKHGKVALERAVTDLLDGAPPRDIRLVGDAGATPRPGAFRVSRDGRADAAIETELAAQLGRIAIVEGSLPRALLQARLHGATAVTMSLPAERPRPWPRDASLVLVLYGTASAWVADLPTL